MGGGRERNGGFLEAGSDSGGVPVRHLHIVSTRRRAAALLFGSFEQFARTAAARVSSSWMRLVFSFPTHQSLITVGSWIESYVFERTSSEDRVLAHSLGQCPQSRSSREPVCVERLHVSCARVGCV